MLKVLRSKLFWVRCKNLGFGEIIMKKLVNAVLVSVIATLSGCSMYTAPWDDASYQKAPVYKEARVYQKAPAPVNSAVVVKKAPVLNAETNTNKRVTSNVAAAKAPVMKEKVINVSRTESSVPNVTRAVSVVERPIEKNVMIIPIE